MTQLPSTSEPRDVVLARQLAARDGEAVERQLMALMVTFRDRAEDPRIVVRAYRMALADLSSSAVVEAINRFARGQVERGSHAFAPSAAEIHVEASRIQGGMHQELDRIKFPPSLEPPRIVGRPVSAPKPVENRELSGVLESAVAQLTGRQPVMQKSWDDIKASLAEKSGDWGASPALEELLATKQEDAAE